MTAPDSRFDPAASDAAPRFEHMTDADLAVLQHRLSTEPELARLLGQARPSPESLLKLVSESVPVREPSAAAWADLWHRIEQRTSASALLLGQARALRLWAPLTAVAAGLLALVALHGVKPAADVTPPMQLASNVEIDDVESSDDFTPMIWSSDGVSVIWLVENGG